jgi:general secretion pathway protein E
MTIEDPIEYELSTLGVAISQSQVNTKKGVSFASGLRHILRQDPDVIMVGEIRDEETARIAVQASLTGHLVLSTLHTNDATGAIARLCDLGVEPYLVAGSLAGVMAQRLARRRHAPCEGRGCAECLHTGFRGRLGLFELLTVSDPMRALIAERASSPTLIAEARAYGLRTLREDGLRLVAKGDTTHAEIQRITTREGGA